jgi:tRNA pseudouridine38-40 synthase
MAEGANHLVGEHDFSSFCRRAGEQHLIRRVNRLTPERAGEGLVTIEVDGQAFCHQMVRSIVAALVRVGRGQQPPSHLATVLATRDRSSVGAIAPPHGLTLVAVDY